MPLGKDAEITSLKSTTLRKTLKGAALSMVMGMGMWLLQNDLIPLMTSDPVPFLVLPILVYIAYTASAVRAYLAKIP